MTFPVLTDTRKRHDAAQSIVIWRKIRDDRRRSQHDQKRDQELRNVDATSAMLCNARAGGYREALHEMFDR